MVNSRPKRVPGFMALARQIVTRNPGLTAQEVVEMAKRTGKVLSAAADPDASWVGTLHKVHKQFGMERRIDDSGRFRFYPKGNSQAAPTPIVKVSASNGGCCITLSDEDVRRVRALVELGRYDSEHEAHRDLVKKGLEELLARLST